MIRENLRQVKKAIMNSMLQKDLNTFPSFLDKKKDHSLLFLDTLNKRTTSVVNLIVPKTS